MNILNSFEINNELFYYHDLEKVFTLYESLKKLPISLKILLEENLRKANSDDEIEYIIDTFLNRRESLINFYPSRVLMKDFNGVPILVDLASLRDVSKRLGKDVNQINPKVMVDLIIDNSLDKDNYEVNPQKQKEEYEFIKWAKNSFDNLRVIPSLSGIFHQINLECLSTIVHLNQIDGKNFLFPETIVGTNSSSSLINSLGVLGSKIGGLEVESTILGFPIAFNLPKVLGVNISKRLIDGVTSSDLSIAIKEILSKYDLCNKIVEFYGEGLWDLSLEDRSILSNDILDFGAKFAFFPIDEKTLLYYDNTRNNNDFSNLIKTYLIKQKLFLENEKLSFDENIEIDLESIRPYLCNLKTKEKITIEKLAETASLNKEFLLEDGDIILAQISSSFDTNPYVFIHAGLVAKKICELGLKANNNIKKIFKIDSLFVKEYLIKLDLLKYFEELGFDIIDKNSDKSTKNMDTILHDEIRKGNLNLYCVSFGNEKVEEHLSPFIKSNYAMSASLVIVYTIAKTIRCNIHNDYIEKIGENGIKLTDIWPNNEFVMEYLNKLDCNVYKDIYKNIFIGGESWQNIHTQTNNTYKWDKNATFIQSPKFYKDKYNEKIEIKNARILAIFEDDIPTKYISSLGKIALYSNAANYLEEMGVKSYDYTTFENRYANAEIMIRSIFDNAMLKNKIVSKEGGFSKDFEKDEIISIYNLSKRFKERDKEAVVFAGKNYGVGKSKMWAEKGIAALGIKAIIAKSFDEKHRLDLIRVGVLPFVFDEKDDFDLSDLKGDEHINIYLQTEIRPNCLVDLTITSNKGIIQSKLRCKLNTYAEIDCYKNGGILNYTLKNIK